MKAQRLGRKRLSIDIPESVHKELKLLAARSNSSVTKVVLKAVIVLFKQNSNASVSQ